MTRHLWLKYLLIICLTDTSFVLGASIHEWPKYIFLAIGGGIVGWLAGKAQLHEELATR